MSEWVRLCGVNEAPAPGEVTEAEAGGRVICLAHVEGRLHAMDNVCPHRQGPLGQGWVEGRAVLCPWHAWAFDVDSGVAEEPERAQVSVFPVRLEGEDVFIDLTEGRS